MREPGWGLGKSQPMAFPKPPRINSLGARRGRRRTGFTLPFRADGARVFGCLRSLAGHGYDLAARGLLRLQVDSLPVQLLGFLERASRVLIGSRRSGDLNGILRLVRRHQSLILTH